MEIREEFKKIIYLIVLFIIVSIVSFSLKYYFKPFFSVLVLIIATTPIYNILRSINIEKHIAAFLGLTIVNLILILTAVYYGNYILDMIYGLVISNKEVLNEFMGSLKEVFDFNLDNIMEYINKAGAGVIIRQGAITTGEGLLSYFVANIFTFFFLLDKYKFYDFISRLIPNEYISALTTKNKNLKGLLIVQINLIIISTIIMSIGFFMLRVDKPIFLASFTAIIDILPYVGSIIVFIPIIIYNIIMKNYFMAIGFIILYIILILVKEILEAKFLSNKLDLHPLIVFLSIYIGLNIFGFLGMIIGPIYCMIAKDIIYKP